MTKPRVKIKDIIDNNNDVEPNKQLKEDIAKRIRSARRARDYTVQYLADHIGVSREVLNQIERGKNHINGVLLYKLATRLDCPISTFFPDVKEEYALGPIGRALITSADPGSLNWIEDMFKKNKK